MNRRKRLQTTWRLSSSSTAAAACLNDRSAGSPQPFSRRGPTSFLPPNNLRVPHLARFWRGGSIPTVRTSATEST